MDVTTVRIPFNWFKLTASVPSVPGAKFTILLFVVPSPMDKLPPEIVTAGVVAPAGTLLIVIEEPPLEIELISFKALAKPTLIVVLPSVPCSILVLILAVLYSSAYALPAVKVPVP